MKSPEEINQLILNVAMAIMKKDLKKDDEKQKQKPIQTFTIDVPYQVRSIEDFSRITD